jgi:hypothetical protein
MARRHGGMPNGCLRDLSAHRPPEDHSNDRSYRQPPGRFPAARRSADARRRQARTSSPPRASSSELRALQLDPSHAPAKPAAARNRGRNSHILRTPQTNLPSTAPDEHVLDKPGPHGCGFAPGPFWTLLAAVGLWRPTDGPGMIIGVPDGPSRRRRARPAEVARPAAGRLLAASGDWARSRPLDVDTRLSHASNGMWMRARPRSTSSERPWASKPADIESKTADRQGRLQAVPDGPERESAVVRLPMGAAQSHRSRRLNTS